MLRERQLALASARRAPSAAPHSARARDLPPSCGPPACSWLWEFRLDAPQFLALPPPEVALALVLPDERLTIVVVERLAAMVPLPVVRALFCRGGGLVRAVRRPHKALAFVSQLVDLQGHGELELVVRSARLYRPAIGQRFARAAYHDFALHAVRRHRHGDAHGRDWKAYDAPERRAPSPAERCKRHPARSSSLVAVSCARARRNCHTRPRSPPRERLP